MTRESRSSRPTRRSPGHAAQAHLTHWLRVRGGEPHHRRIEHGSLQLREHRRWQDRTRGVQRRRRRGDGALPLEKARALADRAIDEGDARIDDKWGPAGCVPLADGRFYFFGWASE
jgi:hypothetical protein